MGHRRAWTWKSIRWGWLRLLPLVVVFVLVPTAIFHQLTLDAREQQRAVAAQQLAQSSPPVATPAITPRQPSPTAVATPTLPDIPLPPTHFEWPAAGLSVDVVPMAWTPGQTVDPPLDVNNFDPVAHWLIGTGQSSALRPIVLAAHACHQLVPLCNDSTFPFNRLSYDGWALGQPAGLTDASGGVVACALTDRRLVDKSKAFTFANDPCSVVVFSCNFENPDGQIVLLTFRCGQCT